MNQQRRVAFVPGVPLTFNALRPKEYSNTPQTLGKHLKKRRRELGLLQRGAAHRMGILTETYANWENGKTVPVAAQFRPVMEFLNYNPTPAPKTLAERLEAKRRFLGATFAQVARYLGWDPGTLTRYLNGTWRMPPGRTTQLEAFFSADVAELAIVLQLPRRR